MWDRPETVQGFVTSPPNLVLMAWAKQFSRGLPLRILDIGCGAGRNSIPLARLGHHVTGVDASLPMLEAARERANREGVADLCRFQHGPMEHLEVAPASYDLVVAHGVWNLATTDLQLVAAVAEAAQAARSGAGLFVFTFSRHTLADSLAPVVGQRHVWAQFSGQAQVFLTESELRDLLEAAGFQSETTGPLTEYNRPARLPPSGVSPRPVLWEGTWRRR